MTTTKTLGDQVTESLPPTQEILKKVENLKLANSLIEYGDQWILLKRSVKDLMTRKNAFESGNADVIQKIDAHIAGGGKFEGEPEATVQFSKMLLAIRANYTNIINRFSQLDDPNTVQVNIPWDDRQLRSTGGIWRADDTHFDIAKVWGMNIIRRLSKDRIWQDYLLIQSENRYGVMRVGGRPEDPASIHWLSEDYTSTISNKEYYKILSKLPGFTYSAVEINGSSIIQNLWDIRVTDLASALWDSWDILLATGATLQTASLIASKIKPPPRPEFLKSILEKMEPFLKSLKSVKSKVWLVKAIATLSIVGAIDHDMKRSDIEYKLQNAPVFTPGKKSTLDD
jgi:hypothetical protein